jgi:hypothetical protein
MIAEVVEKYGGLKRSIEGLTARALPNLLRRLMK